MQVKEERALYLQTGLIDSAQALEGGPLCFTTLFIMKTQVIIGTMNVC